MPSRFEPCGLNQLNSLRYGTLPIVRATGGLSDTVTDASARAGNGFTFTDYSPEALVAAVRRALEAYQSPENVGTAAADRDEEGLLLGRLGPGVCQSVQCAIPEDNDIWLPKTSRP